MTQTSDMRPSTRGSINPYRRAMKLLIDQFAWDIRPVAWISRAKLKRGRDCFSDKKAVIVCNGPSLNKTDFALLENTFCFGLNKINLLFDRTVFRPSCIVAVNPLVIEQNAEFYNTTELSLFLDSCALRHVGQRENVVFLRHGPEGFAQDCSLSVYQGYTVTYVALQLAFHMGFKDVGLVGCDHVFAATGTANATVVAGNQDASHFDPRYFSNGMKWQLPDLIESERSYLLAKKVFESAGRRIVNCTEGGALEIFERQTLCSFILG